MSRQGVESLRGGVRLPNTFLKSAPELYPISLVKATNKNSEEDTKSNSSRKTKSLPAIGLNTRTKRRLFFEDRKVI